MEAALEPVKSTDGENGVAGNKAPSLRGREPRKISTSLGDCFALDGTAYFEPPKMLVDGFLVEGSINNLAGDKKSGKGWVSLFASRRVLEKKKTVLYIDRENGPRRIDERIKVLGGNPVLWGSYFRYCFNPSMSAAKDDASRFEATLDQLKPSLVIFDSWAGFLVAADGDENNSGDITAWSNSYIQPLRAREITTLILDHVPHDQKRPRGSNRKGEEADALFYIKKHREFDRNTTGLIAIESLADRDGLLPKKTHYRLGGENGRFVFEKLDQTKYGLKGKKLEIIEVLESFGDKGATNSEWAKACVAKGVSKSTFQNYLKDLKNYDFRGVKLLKNDGKKYYLKVR